MTLGIVWNNHRVILILIIERITCSEGLIYVLKTLAMFTICSLWLIHTIRKIRFCSVIVNWVNTWLNLYSTSVWANLPRWVVKWTLKRLFKHEFLNQFYNLVVHNWKTLHRALNSVRDVTQYHHYHSFSNSCVLQS